MNASYFHFWNKIRPFTEAMWACMLTNPSQKVRWAVRVGQLALWALAALLLARPLLHLCVWLAEHSPHPLVGLFWAAVGLLVGVCGVAGGLFLLATIPILIMLGLWRTMTKKTTR